MIKNTSVVFLVFCDITSVVVFYFDGFYTIDRMSNILIFFPRIKYKQ